MKFKMHAMLQFQETSGSKFMKGISCCAFVLVTFQEIFFYKLLAKFGKLILKVKLTRDVHKWCT